MNLTTPSWRDMATVLLTLWQITTTATRTFVWNSVVEGTLDVRPLSRALRLLAVLGQLLIAGFLLSILFNSWLRVNGPLEPLVQERDGTRGLLVPSAAIPLTLAAVGIGWGYLLAGAVRVRWWLRWLTALLYLCFAVLPILMVEIGLLNFGIVPVWPLLSPLLVVAALAVLPRLRPRPALEWCIMTALNGMLFCGAVAAAASAEVLSGGGYRVSSLVSSLALNALLLIAPFLYISGLGWIDFGLDLSGWTARAVRKHAAGWLIAALLFALLGYRIIAQGGELLADPRGSRVWLALVGGALFCGGLALIMAWRRRGGPAAPVPRGLVIALLVVPILLQGLIVVALGLSSLAPLVDAFNPDAHRQTDEAIAIALSLSTLIQRHGALILAGIGAAVAVLAARRDRPSVAAYALILAWAETLAWLTASGRPLYALRFGYVEVDRLALLGMAGLALYWLARRELRAGRAVRLLALALLMALLNQTDFLDNPFSPLFSFAGVFFLVFGIVWNVLGAGGFANQETPGMPRASRLMLYLGYVLVSVSVAHWYLVSHNVAQQATQAAFNTNGFEVFGLPLAYLALVEGGTALVAEE